MYKPALQKLSLNDDEVQVVFQPSVLLQAWHKEHFYLQQLIEGVAVGEGSSPAMQAFRQVLLG